MPRPSANKNPLPPQKRQQGKSIQSQSDNAGASDANREWETNDNMDLSVDDEESQRRKWRR